MKRSPVLLLLALVLGALASARAQSPPTTHAAASRTWTTTEGRSFQAALVSAQGGQVTLRLVTGQMATIPLTRLSPADQLAAQAPAGGVPSPASAPAATKTAAFDPKKPATPAKLAPEKRTWPPKVEVETKAIEVALVKESAAEQSYVYRSQNFEFISQDKLAGSVMKEIARTFEATRALVQALPWGIDPRPPADLGYYQAKFYVTRESYFAEGGPKNSGGVDFSKDRIFRIPFPSLGLELRGKTWFKNDGYKNDTIVHEITHQLMHDFLPFLPTWVIEGTAEYNEMLPYNAGRFISGSHERGFKDYLKEAAERGVKPSDMGKVMDHISMPGAAWQERGSEGGTDQHRLYVASCTMVYFFSHLDGDGKGTRFLRYLDEIAEARDAWDAFFKNPAVKLRPDGSFSYRSDVPLPTQKRDDAYGLEQLSVLLDGRSAEQLQKEVTDGFKKIGVKW